MGLNDLVGLDNIKEKANVAIKSCLVRKAPFPHTLLLGPGGLGKTAVARAIAQDLGSFFQEIEAVTLQSRKDINEKILKSQYAAKSNGKSLVLFIDEIHRLPTALQEAFYYPMKEWRIIEKENILTLNPFTLIGATTREDELDQASFMKRFPQIWKLEPYTKEQIYLILITLCIKENLQFTEEALNDIADRALGIPRTAHSFYELVRDQVIASNSKKITPKEVKIVFEREGINTLGLNKEQMSYLSALKEVNGGPRGVAWIASKLKSFPQIVEDRVEPTLIALGYVDRTSSGRQLTESGLKVA